MIAWLEPLLSNAIVATLLALLVAAIALFRPRPAVLHALWLIVLLKFVTPPLIRIELPTDGIRPAHAPTTEAFAETGLASWIPDDGSDRLFADEATPSVSFGGILLDGDDSVGSPLPRDVDPVGIASVETEDRLLGAANGGHEPIGFPHPRRAGNAGRSPSVLVDAVSQLARSLGSRLPEWLPAGFAAIWAAGSAAWFVLAGVRLVRFRRQLGRTRPAGDALQRIADEVAERLGLRARPIVRLTDANLPPMLTTFRRRGLVLLPSELLRGLSQPQQAAIIAHELAHFRRGDHWVRWLEFVVVGLYWWHPVAWLTRRQLQQAEESCCDAWVLRVFPDQAKGYAQALMATVDFLSEVRTPAPAGACGFGRVHSLKRRLEMILKRTWRPDLSSAARLTLLAIALGVLPWTPRAFSQNIRTPDDTKKPASAAKNAEPAEPSTAAEPETAPASTPQPNVPAGAAQPSPPSAQEAGSSLSRDELKRYPKASTGAGGNRNPLTLTRVGGAGDDVRMDALEKQLEAIIAEVKAMRESRNAPASLPAASNAAQPAVDAPTDLVWRRLGLRLSSIEPNQVQRALPQLRGGMHVLEVQWGGPAATAGLRRGDVLLGLHKWETLNFENVSFVLTQHDLNPNEPLTAHVLRDGNSHELQLRLATITTYRAAPQGWSLNESRRMAAEKVFPGSKEQFVQGVETVESKIVSRARYKVPKTKAEALAAFLSEHMKSPVEVKVDDDSLTVTASPEQQTTIGQFIALSEGKQPPASETWPKTPQADDTIYHRIYTSPQPKPAAPDSNSPVLLRN